MTPVLPTPPVIKQAVVEDVIESHGNLIVKLVSQEKLDVK
jgi:hypothetical protein